MHVENEPIVGTTALRVIKLMHYYVDKDNAQEELLTFGSIDGMMFLYRYGL